MVEPNFVDKTVWTGDNLDILRGLNSESVDLIYLDPPFNSNRNYSAPVGSVAAGAAFKDTWNLSDLDVAWVGLIADDHPAIYRTVEAAGLTHNKGMQSYLCMMAVRLLEMRRVLKTTGSIYLHCDPTASHYLKFLMDSVFGHRNFQNEITWQRTTAHNDSVRYGRNSDTILFYSKGDHWTWNIQYQPHDDAYQARFRHKDPDGRSYTDDNLTAKGLSGGGYEYEYKGARSLWRVPLARIHRRRWRWVQCRLNEWQRGRCSGLNWDNGIRWRDFKLDPRKGAPNSAVTQSPRPQVQNRVRTSHRLKMALAGLILRRPPWPSMRERSG